MYACVGTNLVGDWENISIYLAWEKDSKAEKSWVFNIKLNFGIDVYDIPFPEEGFFITENENIDLLVMRHDIKDSQKEKLIKKFLGINNFTLSNTNIGDEKDYSSTYNKFKTLSIPDDYLDKMLNSKYTKHFFLNDIDTIRNKWKSK